MKSLHSYNILDNPAFIESQKIEKRIIRYNAARKSKDMSSSQRPSKLPNTGNLNKQISVTDDKFNYSYNPNAGSTRTDNTSPNPNQFA